MSFLTTNAQFVIPLVKDAFTINNILPPVYPLYCITAWTFI